MQRLIKQESLFVPRPKRPRYGSYLEEIARLLGGRANEKWLTHITEFQIPAGKVYLSPMIDCFEEAA